MVKLVKFLCIAGIIILLLLFVGFTEFGENNKSKPTLTDTSTSEQPEKILETGKKSQKVNTEFSIFNIL